MDIANILLRFSVTLSGEFLVILVLFIYIFYLHLQLAKKNILLKSFYKKIEKPESKLAKKDILLFLENLKNPEFSGKVTKDKLLDKKISNFLFENDKDIKLFLHYTSRKEVADKIMQDGFKFVNSFYKTAEYIYNDELYLVHRHHEHKQYGHFVIVICIHKETYEKYSDELGKIKAKNISVEQILTEKAPITDENSDEIYLLPKQFIKGYFDYTDGTITENNEFNSNYHSPVFQENLKRINPNHK